MKEIKILFAALLAVAYVNVLHAQDLNSAIEAYNLGATAAQEGNYISAIDNLNRALDLANVLGEEGLSVVEDCKNLIPQLYLRHAKELAAGGQGPESLPFLDKASETALAFGQGGITEEVTDLKSKVFYIIANEAFEKDFAGAIENFNKVLNWILQRNCLLASWTGFINSEQEEDGIAALEKQLLGREASANRLLASVFLKRSRRRTENKDWEGCLMPHKASEYQTTSRRTNCSAWPPWS